MKIIFLDIDGVLHSHKHEQWLKKQGLLWYDADGAIFDPECVKALEFVIEITNAKIVISSSWKDSPYCQNVLEILRGVWQRRRMPAEIFDITPILTANDGVSASGRWKGLEIEQWLKNNPECEAYVIVDDQNLFLREQIHSFVKTSPKNGLTMRKAKKLVRILNREPMSSNLIAKFFEKLFETVKYKLIK